ncbi:hypothetical protein ABLO27_15440 [Roseibium sp. SCPC15]|uniref:hypothetical protein n=1 Tax=Roseibium sp. SCP15 TaxID=3141376 RepID=UPI00333C29EB
MIDTQKLDDLFWWMLDGARPSADAREIVTGICDRLEAAGVPVERFALFIYTLHPNLQGRRIRWLAGEGVDMSDADMAAFDGAEYHDNPLPTVLKTGRICGAGCVTLTVQTISSFSSSFGRRASQIIWSNRSSLLPEKPISSAGPPGRMEVLMMR